MQFDTTARLRGRRVLAGTLPLLLAAAITACATTTAGQPSAAPPLPTSAEFFAGEGTIWRTPVPDSPVYDERSDAYVAGFAGPPPVVAIRNFTAPIFVADERTARYEIAPTASYATPEATLARVPIPPNALADPADDGHLAVLDTTTNCVFEMYRAERDGSGGWTAEWVNATPADGDGIYPDGLATRASGFSIAAGLIWPEELVAGRIEHALVFAYPATRAGDPVEPATRSDGRTDAPDALPIGAHVVLDPELDLSTLGLSGPELTIATALQEYGMYLADSSRGTSLFAVHPQSYPYDPYEEALGAGDLTYFGIEKIPFDRMKVLELGAEVTPYKGPVTPNRCSDSAR
ncbi:hypothetical protein [Pseudonocardia lacus]|uniref:hypothetical protein n=1 Tax=Pseudonocardia lacus TaxID=2835865 RepID=UPI001BDD3A7E|nr:hypothetical protein [Pseudonocardia lacus]